jgi:UDP-N-acetylmuramoyl-tripeptide--D-alanyl-D-alanine ligase
VQGLPKDGILVLPAGLRAPEWAGRILRFGEGSEVSELRHVARGESWDVSIDVCGKTVDFSLTPGAPHRVQNALAALASVRAAGLDAAALAPALGQVGIMTGRGVEQSSAGVTLIDDSFNGNPASMAAALQSLTARPARDGRRLAILGDMLELGAEAAAYHQAMAAHLDGVDGVYCVGPLMRSLFDRLPAGKGLGWHEDPATLDPQTIAALLRSGDLVVVKGSKKIFWVNKFVPRLLAALQAKA